MNKIYKHIKFIEDSHQYINTKTGEEYSSATKFIAQFYPKFDGDIVAPDLIANNSRYQQEYADYGFEEAVNHLKQKWEKRTDIGNLIHDLLEKYVNEESIFKPKYPMWNGRVNHLLTAFDRLQLREKYSEFTFFPEMIVFSDKYKLAGQADLILMNKLDKTFLVFDYKTNQKGIEKNAYQDKRMFPPLEHLPDCNYYHYSLQLNLYAYFIEQEFSYNCIGKTLLSIDINSPNQVIIESVPVGNHYQNIELILNH